jgi:hypothetical protein
MLIMTAVDQPNGSLSPFCCSGCREAGSALNDSLSDAGVDTAAVAQLEKAAVSTGGEVVTGTKPLLESAITFVTTTEPAGEALVVCIAVSVGWRGYAIGGEGGEEGNQDFFFIMGGGCKYSCCHSGPQSPAHRAPTLAGSARRVCPGGGCNIPPRPASLQGLALFP